MSVFQGDGTREARRRGERRNALADAKRRDANTNEAVTAMQRVLPGILAATLLVAGAHQTSTAQAQNAERRSEFNIPAQALDTALIAFADQAKVQLAVSADRIAGLKTKGVRGAFTSEGALRGLLADTGLTFRSIGERSYSVTDANAPHADGQSAAGTSSSSDPPATKPPVTLPAIAPTEVAPKREAKERSEKGARNGPALEEVIVTGTLIRDIAPVGAPLTVYDREDIERSGAATVDAFVRKMPENLGSIDATTVSTNQSGGGGGFSQSAGNTFFGSGVNLRGIGPGGTLVLLNGRRMATSGSGGAFVDVSNIPLAALERVEVLADGASALYGGDAIAGVANFVLRKDFDGMETSLRYGGATRGGAQELTASQLAGTSWGGGNVLLTLSHHDHEGLLSTQRNYIPDPFTSPASLLPERKQNSAFLAGRQGLFADIDMLADALYTERDQSSMTPNSPIIMTHRESTVKAFETALTFQRSNPDGWGGTLTGTYSTSDQESTNTFVGIVRAPTNGLADTRSVTSDLRLDGPVFRLPGGRVRAALGVGYRREELDDVLATLFRHFDREVKSAYAELFVPIVGDENQAPLMKRLELSIAGRHDEYDDVGSSTNPKIGLAWSPVEGLRVRGTYGTSFRAPPLNDLTEFPSYANRNLIDPAVPDRITTTLINQSSGNSSLQPEEGESFTVGIDFFPPAIPDLTITSTYFQLQYDERVSRPPLVGSVNTIYSQTALLEPFIRRSPSLAEVQAIFAVGPVFDTAGTGPAGVEAIFDNRITNISDSSQSGIDLSARYKQSIGRADLNLLLRGIRTFDLDYQPAETTPEVTLLDLVGFPIGLQLQAAAEWSYRGFGSSLSLRHVDGYENQFLTPRGEVDSWTTADLQLSYRVADDLGSSLVDGLSIAVDVQNITDEKPPFVLIQDSINTAAFNASYDAVNASPIGRIVSLQIAKRW